MRSGFAIVIPAIPVLSLVGDRKTLANSALFSGQFLIASARLLHAEWLVVAKPIRTLGMDWNKLTMSPAPVKVFPVPGGPKMMYGTKGMPPETIFST